MGFLLNISSLSPNMLKLHLALPSLHALQILYSESIVNVVHHYILFFIFFQPLHLCGLLHI